MDDDQQAAGLLRRLRREADMSQRELAEATGLSHARVARLETGQADLRLGELVLIAALAGARVALLRADGTELVPMTADAVVDGAGRHFPAHLDLRYADEGWWADEVRWTRRRPQFTFTRDRTYRDLGRAARGTAADHPDQGSAESLADRKEARLRARARAAAAEWERRRDAGELRPSPPDPVCTCPPACDDLLSTDTRDPHTPDCPCRCDIA